MVVDWLQIPRCQVFKEVRKLSAKGLNPKGDITDVHVTTTDVAHVFSSVQKFKSTSSMLTKDHRKQLENLYLDIHGISHITNNEFYLWLVKGWIDESKGHPMNWVEVVATTVQEKTWRVNLGSLWRAHGEKLNCNDGSKQASSLRTSLQPSYLAPLDVHTFGHVGNG